MTFIQSTKKTLGSLKNALPHGSIKKISEETGFTRQYVSDILNGNVDITESNKKVVLGAVNIIREKKQMTTSLEKEIAKAITGI